MSIKLLFLCFFVLVSLNGIAQKMVHRQPKIDEAKANLSKPFETFYRDCLLKETCHTCVEYLVKNANNPYKQYLIGGALFGVDPETSFKLHEASYLDQKDELNFNLEYALELHRLGRFEEAIPLYMNFQVEAPKDYRLHVWLSECYLNTGNYAKAIEHWSLADHANNHTGINKAIHTIYSKTTQLKERTNLRAQVSHKVEKGAYELIFLDLNWELDWWNNGTQEAFFKEDMALIANVFGVACELYRDLDAYAKIKQFSKGYTALVDSIKPIYEEANFILNNRRLVPSGKISSDLLRIAFTHKFVSEKDVFANKGVEILALADAQKDVELLNIYAYLEAVVHGGVSVEIDKKGWQEYHTERFAVSYFMGLSEDNKYDNPDLIQALVDFPNSAKLQWVKLMCAKTENREMKVDLIDAMKIEFKSLGSDPSKFSNGLSGYFRFLETLL